MDRIELRSKFQSRIEKFPLEEFGLEVWLRRLSGLARAKLQLISLELGAKKKSDPQEVLQFQCQVIAEGLVDAAGARLYKDDESGAVAEEIPGVVIDQIATKILKISSTEFVPKVEEISKNLAPIPSDDSPSA